MLSQLVDTILVTTVIFIGIEDVKFIGSLIWDGWLFKVLFAAVDTVVIYIVVFFFRKSFNLKSGEEIEF